MGMLDDIFARFGQGALAEGAPALLPRYLANEGLPPPPGAATPDFTLALPAPRSEGKKGGEKVTFPPAQIFGETIPVQGFGDAPPLASPSPAAPSAPASAPAVPSWLGMLNGAPMPQGMDAGGYPTPPAPAAPSSPPPRPAPPSPSSSMASADVPETSLAGRLGNGFGDLLKGFNDWRNDHRLTLMALGAGMAGAQNLGQGLNRGMTMALPAMQQDIAQQHQNQTVAALVKRGIPQDVALAAVGNPAVMQQIIGQVFGPKAYQHVTVKKPTGEEVPLVFDPASGKYRTATGETYGAGAAPNTELHGEEFLKTQDPGVRDDIRAMAEGRLPSAGFGAQKTLLPLVAQYDPNFDATQYPTMLATRKNYTSGKQFQELQAINTVAGHLDDLRKAADGLDNTSFPLLNSAINAYRTNTGDARVDNFNTVKQAVTNELSKAYRGGHVTEGDVREWQENISAAKSPEQLRGVIGKMNDLLASKRQALEDGYRSSMGAAPLPSEFKATSDRAADVFNRVADWAHGVKPAAGSAPTSPAPAPASAAPVPGGHYQWTPDGSLIQIH